jgi:hypothetical protein
MNKTIVFITALALVLMSFTGCEKEEESSGVFQAKLLASFCAFHIVEIQDSAFYTHGMDWTDSRGKVYQHVFAVRNYCEFAKANIQTGQTFNCTIIEKVTDENCAVCLGFMETPPLGQNIKVVR